MALHVRRLPSCLQALERAADDKSLVSMLADTIKRYGGETGPFEPFEPGSDEWALFCEVVR